MQRHKTLTRILSLTVLVLLSLTACSQFGQAETATPEPLPAAEINPVVSSTGEVVPAQYSTLGVTLPGTIEELPVREGGTVQAGDILLRLQGKEDLQAAVTAAQAELVAARQARDQLDQTAEAQRADALARMAQANQAVRDAKYLLDNYDVPHYMEDLAPAEAVELYRQKLDEARDVFEPLKYKSEYNDQREDALEDLDNAQADYNTAVKWWRYSLELRAAEERLDRAIRDYQDVENGPKPADLETAEARIASAQAALQAAQAALDDLEIRAPFAGTVTTLDARTGEYVAPGQPLITLADLQHLQIETTDLNEIDVARIAQGDTATVTFDALPDVEVAARVVEIALRASAGSGVNYTVTLELDDIPPALRWGMTAFVDIEIQED